LIEEETISDINRTIPKLTNPYFSNEFWETKDILDSKPELISEDLINSAIKHIVHNLDPKRSMMYELLLEVAIKSKALDPQILELAEQCIQITEAMRVDNVNDTNTQDLLRQKVREQMEAIEAQRRAGVSHTKLEQERKNQSKVVRIRSISL